MDGLNQKALKQIALWGRIIGITSMIFGTLSALIGLTALVIGAIPGLITVVLGYFLYKSGTSAKALLEQENEMSLNELLDYYAKYLMLNGIFFVLGLVLTLVALAIGGVASLSLMGSL